MYLMKELDELDEGTGGIGWMDRRNWIKGWDVLDEGIG